MCARALQRDRFVGPRFVLERLAKADSSPSARACNTTHAAEESGTAGGKSDEVCRAAAVLRPLGPQNTDARLIQHTLNGPETRHIARLAHVRGRNLLANVLEVDTEARVHGLRGNEHRLLVLTCFDFAAAFPSVALRLAMMGSGMPGGSVRFVAKLYGTATLHSLQADGEQPLSFIVSRLHFVVVHRSATLQGAGEGERLGVA